MSKVYDEPSIVVAESGEVQLDGPDGVAIAMTPEAAAETSDRLLAASARAMDQRLEARRLQREHASLTPPTPDNQT